MNRLITLADYLDTVDPVTFNIHAYITGRIGNSTHDELVVAIKEKQIAACAIGHCSIVFPEECRFILEAKRSEYNTIRVVLADNDAPTMTAMSKFFGITHADYAHLFHPSSYWIGCVMPWHVAHRIRNRVQEIVETQNIGN